MRISSASMSAQGEIVSYRIGLAATAFVCVLAHAADANWPMYNQTHDARRYSPLDQINAGNVAGLKEVCRQRVGELGGFGAGPIVADGVMYVTFGNATLAMNPVDCGINWKSLYVPEKGRGGNSNRGTAISDGRLFRGTSDGKVIAIEAANGREVWRVQVADIALGESVNAAPIVWDRKVFIGIAGSEMGIRGRVMALDAGTGAVLWQFNTVPQGTEFGTDTWKGDSWKTGGGGTWSTATLDPETGEVFFPVGNPAPDFFVPSRLARKKTGVNLFTNSILALDARNGKLSWYHQATPADDRDLDQAAAPMLFTLGDGRSALAAASKDGYLRVIDRKTHGLIYKVAITTIRDEKKPVTTKGVVACPGVLGGTQWNGPAYDETTRTIIVGAVDWCTFLQSDESAEYKKGGPFFGGRMTNIMDPAPTGWITAVDADTGAVRWKFQAPAPIVSGITPTGGGITFAGDIAGTLYALRTSDGKVLFSTPTAGSISGGIVTYSVAGKQYVATTSGNLSRTMWVTAGLPHIIIYTVGDVASDAGVAATGARFDVERGAGAFIRGCSACHGIGANGGTGPGLRGAGKKFSAQELAAQIRSPRPTATGPATMPPFAADALPDASLRDIVAYLETL
jgi:alcohol dehydrogenase (cytochrome c)